MTGGAGPDDESLGEFGRIARYLAPLAADPGAIGLVDDAAELGHGLIATADAIVEGVHFLPSDPPELIARKLLRVNLSDLAAKGATPLHYLLTMALPARCDDRWVERFAAGLAEDQQLFGIVLMGGDSVSTPGPVTLSVTAIGRAAPGGMVRRGGARAGDELWVSGTIGDGALGLLAATGQLMEPDGYLAGRYRLPEPRVALGPALAGLVHAMMDVSDGLVGDLEHMATASGAAATVDAIAVPLSDATAAAVASDPSLFATVLTGGDDYELLFAAPAAAAPSAGGRDTGPNFVQISRAPDWARSGSAARPCRARCQAAR
jgi:thiamine-monophosphate kinase